MLSEFTGDCIGCVGNFSIGAFKGNNGFGVLFPGRESQDLNFSLNHHHVHIFSRESQPLMKALLVLFGIGMLRSTFLSIRRGVEETDVVSCRRGSTPIVRRCAQPDFEYVEMEQIGRTFLRQTGSTMLQCLIGGFFSKPEGNDKVRRHMATTLRHESESRLIFSNRIQEQRYPQDSAPRTACSWA
jgi:hypothetical protein